MPTQQAINALNLLGQGADSSPALSLPGRGEPKLEVAWGSFHQGALSSAKILLFGARAAKDFLGDSYFRECWVQRRMPMRAVLAAALCHIVLVIVPFPNLPAAGKRNPAFENAQLTWSGQIQDLPLLEIPVDKPKSGTRGASVNARPREGADAFHPRQRIFTDPVRPTHPRQTLINSAAPPEAPTILPSLPNIVQLQQVPGPARPKIQISEQALAKLRPRKARTATVTDGPPPDVRNLESKPAELNFAMSPNVPAKPKMLLNMGAAPRMAHRAQAGEVGPAPELASEQSAASNMPSTLIALSAAPAPPEATVDVPPGNLFARIAISPEGKRIGAPGGESSSTAQLSGGVGEGSNHSGGAGGASPAGKNSVGISIRGGNPPASKGASGLGGAGKITLPTGRGSMSKPSRTIANEDPPERTGPPNFAVLPPGAKPEGIFQSKHVYSLNVNMPNLNSVTGSWILNFSELRISSDAPHVTSGELAGPVPLRKVDPKYPPTLINEHVEGEVVLYAVIRTDGSVGSIQLVRGIDGQLDANAMQALSQWKFQPASRQGEAVTLEAIVHIPFHALAVR
jgi:TonB family protein